MSALEDELCAKAGTLKSLQNEMVQSKKELAARELSIQKARDELSLAHTRMAKESERVKLLLIQPVLLLLQTDVFHTSANFLYFP